MSAAGEQGTVGVEGVRELLDGGEVAQVDATAFITLVNHHLDAVGPTAGTVADLWRAGAASRMAVCVRAVQCLPARRNG